MPGVNETGTAVEELVARALELRDAGRADWLEAACDGDDTRMDEVRRAVDDASALPDLLKSIAKRDGRMGQVLGDRFQLRERLGAGAMGVVYAARDTTLDRQVAVKVLRHGLTERESTTQRFAREARAMASVEHEAVITIHDRGTTSEEEPFLVMELVDGVALSEIVQAAAERPTSRNLERAAWIQDELGLDLRGEASYVRTVTRWICELANGLTEVHGAGVLHRDIKPSNIIVRRDGRPVLLDFGIALLDGDSSLTRGQTSVGTPSYMPPEALGRNKRTAASDVYSLAATLHHLLALAPPYEGNPSQVLAAIATREPIPARTHRPGIPRDLQAILDKGLQRKPSARYGSCAELEADLLAFLEYRPISVRPLTAPERWLKRTVRSRMVQGGAAALLAVAGYFAIDAVRESRAADARERFVELRRELPPSLGVLDSLNRAYPEAVRGRVFEVLDGAVVTGAEPVTARMLRAAFRLDQGDVDGAAEDMRALARAVGSPFTRHLADAYAALPAGTVGGLALDLGDEYPEPEGAVDHYVFAYHLVRYDDPAYDEYALEFLRRPDVREIDHAELLRIVLEPLDFESRTVEIERARELFDDLLALESRMGGRTAETLHQRSRILLVRDDSRGAMQAAMEGLRLAPDEHSLHFNAALSALSAGNPEVALENALAAMELRPGYWRPLHPMAWSLASMGRFDEALERLAAAPIVGGDYEEAGRSALAAALETHRALRQFASAAGAEAAATVERAAVHRDRAVELWPFLAEDPPRAFAMLERLEENDLEGAYLELLHQAAEDPLHWWTLREIHEFMPPDLTPETSYALKAFMESLTNQMEDGSARD